jgi:chemotaxis protein CheZ
MAKKSNSSTQLEQARSLVAKLEAGDQEGANEVLAELSPQSDSGDLFHEVGRLTRELHDAINGFLLDEKVTELAEKDIPDAGERLRYVITMTEQSANTTLSLVESSIPMTDEMSAKANALSAEWERFKGRELSVEDFRMLSRDLIEFLGLVEKHAGELHSNLTEVLMAQGFQDITGQIIRQVINLVNDVEAKLVQLVRISGAHLPEVKVNKNKEKLAGPAVPGVEQGEMLQGQDDVDDLLSSLGF